jgi:Na+-translocating ferredoxin:NAD+ oxidoreductase subunit B
MIVLAEITVSFNVVSAGLAMLGLGAVFAIVLLIASQKLKVTVEPKIAELRNALPGRNCGACGFAGCDQYATAILADPSLLGRCSLGGPPTSARLAEIMNIKNSDTGPYKRPIVHCRAGRGDKTFFAGYSGISSCLAANAMPNVQACAFGCLGYGDCVAACKFDALHIVDGLATVNYEKCTGCTACSKACPRNLIEMVPFAYDDMMTVACRSRENGKNTRAFCKVGCIGCGLCAKQSDIFTVKDNLARLDYIKYQPNEKNEAAMNKCPTKVIIYRGKTVARKNSGQRSEKSEYDIQ